MNEILQILGMLIFIVFFRYLSWFQFIILGAASNGLQYCYQNKKNLKKFIRKQNNNLTFTKAIIIICIGIPLILIDIFTKIMGFLSIIWNLFVKTNMGRGVEEELIKGDNYIKNKKSELKSKAIQYIIQKSMPGFNDNKDIKLPNFGNMEGLGDLFKNPEEMGKMMQSLGKVMGNLDVNKMQNISSSDLRKDHNSQSLIEDNIFKNPEEMDKMMQSFGKVLGNLDVNKSQNIVSSDKNNITRPVIEDDLFNKINKYMEEESSNISTNKKNINSIVLDSDDENQKLKKQVLISKNINKRMRKRIKKRNKKNVNKKEFNDMKNLTKTLQQVVKELDVD